MPDTSHPSDAPAPTPFMAQYLAVKAKHADALLFFRMGDFFEMFFADAEDAAAVLGITLTARGEYEGKPIPMAGVPVHASEAYLARLIKAGRRVVICEQTESPAEAKKRGSKAIVQRDVVRIVTPGTVTEDALLPPNAGRALSALVRAPKGGEAALAVCDVSTGRFEVLSVDEAGLADALAAWPVAECLLVEGEALPAGLAAAVTLRPARAAQPKHGEALLKEAFGTLDIAAFGAFTRLELAAIGLLLDYVKLTQAGSALRLDPPERRVASNFLMIDPASRASLEIDRTLAGERAGSLLAEIDRTRTAPGARQLAADLAQPLRDRKAIEMRLDTVSYLVLETLLLEKLASQLSSVPDMERARTRLALLRGGPRDLSALGIGLKHGEAIAAEMLRPGAVLPEMLKQVAAQLTLAKSPDLAAFASDLSAALVASPPVLARDGGFVAPGWDASLDEACALRDDSRRVIAELQARYAGETGIAALKIKYNAVLGYFIEVPARHGETLLGEPWTKTFVHRQTLAGNVRFSTRALSELAGKISRAEEESLAREMAVFEAFWQRALALSDALSKTAAALARLDVAVSHALWAGETGSVRPQLDDAPVFLAEGLRHPVVEAARRSSGDGFTANDLKLDARGERGPRLCLITGPNMAGKSTYLRQAALAVILAQAGGFVPARSLRLGLADRVFSRVGASDDLSRGRSTFMLEMVETAAILRQATHASFVILDEVGRGTATWDGLAIASAVLEHLHDVNQARAVFATHYHELTRRTADLPYAANASLRAKEWKNTLVFLHDVQPGPADRSYGVQVAALAGLPKRAVQRAGQILKSLEAAPAPQAVLPLFDSALAKAPVQPQAHSAVEERLAAINPDQLTAKAALDLLYELKGLAEKDDQA